MMKPPRICFNNTLYPNNVPKTKLSSSCSGTFFVLVGIVLHMAPFMRLRLVQCILTATPNNRFSKTEQLPALVQSWLSIVSLSRQINSSLGDKAWPIHDGEARRVYCTGIWLNMPGR